MRVYVHSISYNHAVYLYFALLSTHKIDFFARPLYKQIGETIISNRFVIVVIPNIYEITSLKGS